MSRTSKLENPAFASRLRKAFHEAAACTEELAGVMGISKKTCQRYLNKINLHYKKGRPRGTKSKNPLTGGLALWIRLHPKEKLPSKISDIIIKTGLSRDQVKCFLYRVKKKQLKNIKSLGDIRKYSGGLRGTRGTLVRFSDMKEYSIRYSPFNEDLKIKALLKNNERIEFKTTLSLLKEYKGKGEVK